MSQPSVQTRYTHTLPDGNLITWDHLKPGDLVQVYVGSWPYATEFADIVEARTSSALVRFEEGDSTPRWVPVKRIASILRPVAG
ncbi:hypothetical protein [Streptomyces sp. NBC_01750]|uniref:hypothetical protein n=1 Tax=Streptomyces sp. NBC_01750 TaxID=2975928 RepID=UPI002DD7EA6A|nr:hypothetical protein [Streptomyces sp. NBC_01750]WSD38092.1 hypothetical protein OG966_40290 [Streptomyces sp. NBC_01750]